MRDGGTGPAPEVGQGRRILPPDEIPRPPKLGPKIETPEEVIHGERVEDQEEEVDPRIVELEKYPDEEIFALCGKYAITVEFNKRTGAILNRDMAIKALAFANAKVGN